MNLEDIPLSIQLIALGMLVAWAAFLTGSETALMALNRYKLRHQAEQGHWGARLAQQLLEQPERLAGLILLAKYGALLLIIQLATLLAWQCFGQPSLALFTSVLIVALLIFAEILPKSLAARQPERLAFLAAPLYVALLKLVWPLIWLITTLATAPLRLLRLPKVSPNSRTHNRAELRSIMQAASPNLSKSHLDMLLSVLDLETATVEDVMIPRTQMVGIDLTDPWSEIIPQLLHSPFTRVLVYEGNLDQVLGLVHLRKLLPLLAEAKLDQERLRTFIRPAYFVPEGTSLTGQLLNFQEAGRRTAIVVDEYGDILGLLTLSDILEEIVGDFSTVPDSQQYEIQAMEDGSYWLDGAMHIREVNRELGIDLPTDGPKTLNGLITDYLESIPVPGMTVLINQHPMEIRKVRKNAIKTLIIYPRIQRKTGSEEHG